MDRHQLNAQQIDLHDNVSCTVLWSFGASCSMCNEPIVLFYGAPKTRRRQECRIVCNRCRRLDRNTERNNRDNLTG